MIRNGKSCVLILILLDSSWVRWLTEHASYNGTPGPGDKNWLFCADYIKEDYFKASINSQTSTTHEQLQRVCWRLSPEGPVVCCCPRGPPCSPGTCLPWQAMLALPCRWRKQGPEENCDFGTFKTNRKSEQDHNWFVPPKISKLKGIWQFSVPQCQDTAVRGQGWHLEKNTNRNRVGSWKIQILSWPSHSKPLSLGSSPSRWGMHIVFLKGSVEHSMLCPVN